MHSHESFRAKRRSRHHIEEVVLQIFGFDNIV